MLVAFRFLDGCVGSTPLVLGGGSIADLILQEKRGGIMAIWAIGPLLGPVVGPIAGEYVAENLGWRWVFWIIAIVVGVNVFR
jgi:MFS family permease